jgi:ribonucleoside-diphosphate reductase alpha chain
LTPAPFEQSFAHSIYRDRYQHPQDGDWFGTAKRVTGAVMPALFHAPGARRTLSFILRAQERVYGLMADRKFIPGGRYLYAAGRDLHQVNNCILLRPTTHARAGPTFRTRRDGDDDWRGHRRLVRRPAPRGGAHPSAPAASASGPHGKMCMTNDMGRYLTQGGNRRCAIWAGLPWWHPDVLVHHVQGLERCGARSRTRTGPSLRRWTRRTSR